MPQRLEGSKARKVNFVTLSVCEEEAGRKIVDAAYAVHKELGPGLLESVYETCLCHELTERGCSVRRQVKIPVLYKGIEFSEGLRLDVLVDDLVICELKAVDEMHNTWQAQILSHMKLTGKHLGYLINFNVPLIKNGIWRFIR